MSNVMYHVCGKHDGNPICYSGDKTLFLDALQKMQPINRKSLLVREARGQKVLREHTADDWLHREKIKNPKRIIRSEIRKLMSKYKKNDSVYSDLRKLSNRLVRVVC